MDKEHYNKLLKESITNSYNLADDQSADLINRELKPITDSLNISDMIKAMTNTQSFITLKDHKDNFQNKQKCRLINLAKINLGPWVSKQILENIKSKVRSHTKANQWRNTTAIIDWFKNLRNKPALSFVVFDIVDFYSSIAESLLLQALEYASQFAAISEQDKSIIMHTRKSLLFDNDKPWCKKNNANMFDVTMGSFDGPEVCELVGLLILSKLKCEFSNKVIGVYRDDGLTVFRNIGPRPADNLRTRITKCFDRLALKIAIQSNLKIVNYLDVTFNLTNNSYYPYRKLDNPPRYINIHSNHLPSIIKQVPDAISKRISSLSCNIDEFNKAAPLYNEALKKSGFNDQFSYRSTDHQQQPKNNRQRKVNWLNPPYSKNVHTNVGKTFLHLVTKHFPSGHAVNKIFNRRNTKVSYSCMGNMSSIIKHHKEKSLTTTTKP